MERLTQFLPYILDEKAVLFFGSGISSLAGCFELQDIRNSLVKIKTTEQQLKNQNIKEIPTKEIIAFYKNSLSSDEEKREFEGKMRGALTQDPDKFQQIYRPFIRKLKLIKPLPAVLTTNMDSCLTDTKEFEMAKIFYRLPDMRIDNLSNGSIFHLHGYKENVNDQLWAIYDYPKRYENKKFKEFLKAVFLNYSVLFLGYSFGDNELRQLLSIIKKEKSNNSNIVHFALIPTDNEHSHIDEQIYESVYNIKIIKYGEQNRFTELLTTWIDLKFNDKDLSCSR